MNAHILNDETDETVCLCEMSYCVRLFVGFRAEAGHGCRLLEDDMGTEISHYCHADESEREKRGLCVFWSMSLY